MSIYFGSTEDAELISELKHRGYCVIKSETAKAANTLADKELTRLVNENFGFVPRDLWTNSVLDLRDNTEGTK